MSATKPLVSIIMNCYNSDQYLKEAIESVYTQTYDNWEIIFWDNASIDSSSDIANSFDERLKYYRGDLTVPLGHARNLAIDKAQGELIAFLDCDDLWLPSKLEKQIPLFDDPEVSLVFCDVESFNLRGQTKRLGSRKKFVRGNCFEELLIDYFLILSSVVVRRSSLLHHKISFREYYDMVEEVDVFLRIAYFGKINFANEVLAKWRVHAASVTWRRFHLLADETEQMLQEFRSDWPGVALKYANGFNARECWIVRQRAMEIWMNAGGREMRSYLHDCNIKLPMKIWLLYLASWFDASYWLPKMRRVLGAHLSP